MTNETTYRPLTEREHRILMKFMDIDFIGRDQLAQQLPGLLAKQIDETGTLEFQAASAARSPRDGCVAEARFRDADTRENNSAHIILLLHVKHGKLWLLEVYKEDASSILKQPDASGLIDLFTSCPPKQNGK